MANGVGVSVSKRRKRGRDVWVVRWRVQVVDEGERRWASRQKTVTSEAAAVELRARVLKSLDVGEVFRDVSSH
jgi:hypothetical protein